MRYKVPIDFTITADSPEEARLRINEFLEDSIMTGRSYFQVVDYEVPYGYPAESLEEEGLL